jgi:hypothetical protein
VKKLILAIAIVLGSLISTTTYAQKAEKIDPVAAISKGDVTSPTPGILSYIADNDLQWAYDLVKDDVIWYKYKGLIYASYIIGPGNPFGITTYGHLVVVFSPKGEPLDAIF